MSRIARPLLPLVLAGSLLAACGSAAAPTPTDAPTAVPSPTTAAPTAAPPATPVPPPPAPVTGTFTSTPCCHITLTLDTTDSRASGTATFDLQAQESKSGREAWEWGDMQLSNDGGSWDGSCRGGGWDDGVRTELSCWLTGQGGYEGLTYFQHISVLARSTGEVYGLILAVPAPTL